MRSIRSLALVAVVLAAAACGSDATAPDGGDQGIRGVVLLGPTCPVETEASPCPDRPLADVTIRIFRDGTPLNATATSGADGRFELRLPPDDYTLEPVLPPGGPGMSARPVDVSVHAGAYVQVTVRVDSGIR